jgi:hypothetical protein
VAELIGPSGCGKTSLARALRGGDARIAALPCPGRLEQLPQHLRNAPLWLPALLRGGERPFTWSQARAMSYLGTWLGSVRRLADEERVVLMDQGPVFRLAFLSEFGAPALTRRPAFRRWWEAACARWAERIDLVLWLDAPDALLLERVRRRSVPHPIQGLSDAEARAFLALYRRGFEEVVGRLQRAGGASVLRLGGGEALEVLAARAREALAGGARAA